MVTVVRLAGECDLTRTRAVAVLGLLSGSSRLPRTYQDSHHGLELGRDGVTLHCELRGEL
jgi:hypothetical protein